MGNSSSQPTNEKETNKSTWFSNPFNNSTTETQNPNAMQQQQQYPNAMQQQQQYGGTRRRKRTTKKNKTRGRINFSKIKWGSFTKIYNNFIKNNPHMKMHILDLCHFAHYVNNHPSQFNKKTHKKALFYTNVIERK
jgi:hypothetical protein